MLVIINILHSSKVLHKSVRQFMKSRIPFIRLMYIVSFYKFSLFPKNCIYCVYS